jgi:UDP-glucuronate 4-epimerase
LTNKKKVLITGASGFIGFHLSLVLQNNNINVVGVDNLNDYYSVSLKQSRLGILKDNNVNFYETDITNFDDLKKCLLLERPDIVVHLAAQAGVRYSLDNPYSYIHNNIIGTFNILEICKNIKIEKLIFASSSSVYGNLNKEKFNEKDIVDNPLNLYSASKKSNELMAYSYSNLYKIPLVGLRFFTVYGPWGRPDMAYFKFTKNIINDLPIEIYGHGKMYRDFTYIDDIIDGIEKIIKTNNNKLFNKNTFYQILNLGNDNPVELNYFISIIENAVGKKAKKIFLDIQPGDVERTSANLDKVKSKINYSPKTNIEEGILKFVKWYQTYYQ